MASGHGMELKDATEDNPYQDFGSLENPLLESHNNVKRWRRIMFSACFIANIVFWLSLTFTVFVPASNQSSGNADAALSSSTPTMSPFRQPTWEPTSVPTDFPTFNPTIVEEVFSLVNNITVNWADNQMVTYEHNLEPEDISVSLTETTLSFSQGNTQPTINNATIFIAVNGIFLPDLCH